MENLNISNDLSIEQEGQTDINMDQVVRIGNMSNLYSRTSSLTPPMGLTSQLSQLDNKKETKMIGDNLETDNTQYQERVASRQIKDVEQMKRAKFEQVEIQNYFR